MDIPVNSEDLDSIIYNVSRDIIEQKAIDGKIEGVTEENSKEIINDVVFTIERYMYYINELISSNRLIQATQTKIK